MLPVPVHEIFLKLCMFHVTNFVNTTFSFLFVWFRAECHRILLFRRKKDDTVIGNVVSTLIWIRLVTILPLQLAIPNAFILTTCHLNEWASHYHCNTWLLGVTCNKTSFLLCTFLLIKHLVWKYKDLVLSTHDDCIHIVHSKTGVRFFLGSINGEMIQTRLWDTQQNLFPELALQRRHPHWKKDYRTL